MRWKCLLAFALCSALFATGSLRAQTQANGQTAAQNQAFVALDQGRITPQQFNALSGGGGGTAVPEIDPGFLGNALALLGGGVLLLRGRMARK